MRSSRTLHWLFQSLALFVSSALHAQARPPAPEPPNGATVRPEDLLSEEEKRDANPCYRRRTSTGQEFEIWWKQSWMPVCIERERSLAVARAWATGLDEYGAPLDAGTRARKLAEMELWLRSFAGKFRVDGRYWNLGGTSPARGTAECFGIGSGPGVSCVISAAWKAPREAYKDKMLDKSLSSAMQPLVLLFGIDPGALLIRMTLLDFRAVTKSGFLVDGSVVFEGRLNFESNFLQTLVTYTWEIARVATNSVGDLDMKFAAKPTDFIGYLLARQQPQPIEFDLHLHRESRVEIFKSGATQ